MVGKFIHFSCIKRSSEAKGRSKMRQEENKERKGLRRMSSGISKRTGRSRVEEGPGAAGQGRPAD
jgi:hypothetical protein